MNKFVCNTGADPNPFTYYYACSLCIDVPFPRKKKKKEPEDSRFPRFFLRGGIIYTQAISLPVGGVFELLFSAGTI